MNWLSQMHLKCCSVIKCEVEGLKVRAHLFGLILFFFFCTFTLPPVSTHRDVQQRLARQHFPEAKHIHTEYTGGYAKKVFTQIILIQIIRTHADEVSVEQLPAKLQREIFLDAIKQLLSCIQLHIKVGRSWRSNL